MVESAEEDSCCGPHVFTSVLLGVLACVLMTGGVFLAFHRWDPLWLIVSGVGVILVLIGSVLHCCRNVKRPLGGGCCLPDLHNHVVLNGGSLAEQLLPLTNARSVSQLSLNMLPGYFPPVVQNSIPGKNLILLSLPGNTPIQNLVSQLEGSVLAETSNSSDVPSSSSSSVANPPHQTHIPILKDAEVQTCAAWPLPNFGPTPGTSSATSEQTVNLMDCSSETICDAASAEIEDTPRDEPPSIQEVNSLLEISSPSSAAEPLEVLVDLSTETVIDTPSSLEVPQDSATENNLSNTNCLPPCIDSITDCCTERTMTPNDNSSRLDENSENSSLVDDSMGRSSPPPSYEDVALQGALAYGTL